MLAGESWEQGQVILSWPDCLDGAADPRDGANVVIHEFVHLIDMANAVVEVLRTTINAFNLANELRTLDITSDGTAGYTLAYDNVGNRTGKTVTGEYANWTTHPNNPMKSCTA